jgi:hypothetical protein
MNPAKETQQSTAETPQHVANSLCQLEGVELFRRSSKVAELVCEHCHGRKRERGKLSSKQGVQILDCADTFAPRAGGGAGQNQPGTGCGGGVQLRGPLSPNPLSV